MTPPHIAKINAKLKGGMPLTHELEGKTKDETEGLANDYLAGLDGMLDGDAQVEIVEKPRFKIALLSALSDQLFLMNTEGWTQDEIDAALKGDPVDEQRIYDQHLKPVIYGLISELDLDEPSPATQLLQAKANNASPGGTP